MPLKYKRLYERIKTNMSCIVYKNHHEAAAQIINISEGGLCFQIDTDDYSLMNLKKNDKIKVHFWDTIEWFNTCKEKVILVDARIIYIMNNGHNLQIGCSISNSRYEKYVLDKKSVKFVKTLKFLRNNYESK